MSTEPIKPVCPHCDADPASYRFADLLSGNGQFTVVFCGNDECRKTISVCLVAIKKKAPDVVMPESRIMIPS